MSRSLILSLAVILAPNLFGQGLEHYLNAVVGVTAISKDGKMLDQLGTGVVVSVEGGTVSILTARHLFYPGKEKFAGKIAVTFYPERSKVYSAVLKTDSPNLDLAILTAIGVPEPISQKFPTFSLRPARERLDISDTLTVFGGASQDWEAPTVQVSALRDGDRIDRFRFTGIGIDAGFSGAPLLDKSGRLVALHLGKAEAAETFGHAQRIEYACEIFRSFTVTMNRVDSAVCSDQNQSDVRERLNPKDGLTYVWIPPGKFTMGCSPGDNDCADNEKPPREVEIHQGFWLSQTTATVQAWHKYRLATNKPELPRQDSQGRKFNEAAGDNLPAVAMSWSQAQSFCEWSGGRLPTEAEWEYAARAGTKGSRYGKLDEIAWYANNSGKQNIESQLRSMNGRSYDEMMYDNGNGPLPVAHKAPNPWALYDMLGNVWQWTADKPGEGVAYYGQRVSRGGSWSNLPELIRASLRLFISADFQNYGNIGTRCVGESAP